MHFRSLALLLMLSSIMTAQEPLLTPDPSFTMSLSEPLPDLNLEFQEQPIRRFKKQALQSVEFSTGWLTGTEGDLSNGFFEASIGTGIPLGSFDNILGVTPAVRVDIIDAAASLDVPSELYDFGVSFFYRRPISNRLRMMAIVRPSLRSDLTTSDDAFRVFGLGLLTWDWVPEKLSISFGAVALGRADLPVLPALGLTWTPSPTQKLNLTFPESSFTWRVDKDGAKSETWGKIGAGLGGNTWAVTRASGATDELSLRDYRIVAGIDHVTDGGGGWFAEVGFAFRRSIEFEVTQTEVDLGNGVFLQAGWRY